LAAEAKERQLAGVKIEDHTQKSAEGVKGETRDIIAKKAEVSHDTISKVERIQENAIPKVKEKPILTLVV